MCAGRVVDEARVDHVRDRDRVVDRRAAEPVELRWKRRVEVEQLGDDRADPARAAQLLGVGVGERAPGG